MPPPKVTTRSNFSACGKTTGHGRKTHSEPFNGSSLEFLAVCAAAVVARSSINNGGHRSHLSTWTLVY
eukprot:scaffold85870_cov39-Phaeocystis_antarctica.AAC.1